MKWTAPKGKTLTAVVRDATRQVIRNYGETLRRLAK